MKRQRKTIESKIEEVNRLKVEIQELKFERNVAAEEIRERSVTTEGNFEAIESAVSKVKKLEWEIKCNDLKGIEQFTAETKRKQFEHKLKYERRKFER